MKINNIFPNYLLVFCFEFNKDTFESFYYFLFLKMTKTSPIIMKVCTLPGKFNINLLRKTLNSMAYINNSRYMKIKITDVSIFATCFAILNYQKHIMGENAFNSRDDS